MGGNGNTRMVPDKHKWSDDHTGWRKLTFYYFPVQREIVSRVRISGTTSPTSKVHEEGKKKSPATFVILYKQQLYC